MRSPIAVRRAAPRRVSFWLLVNRVVTHFRPGVIEQGLDLNLGAQSRKLPIFGKRQSIRFQADEVVRAVKKPGFGVSAGDRVMNIDAEHLEILVQRARTVEPLYLGVSQEHHPTASKILDLVHLAIKRYVAVVELLPQRSWFLGTAGDRVRDKVMLIQRLLEDVPDDVDHSEIAGSSALLIFLNVIALPPASA